MKTFVNDPFLFDLHMLTNFFVPKKFPKIFPFDQFFSKLPATEL